MASAVDRSTHSHSDHSVPMLVHCREGKRMKDFIRAAAIRAVRTIAQTAIATIGTSAILSDVNWGIVISASVLAGILSILTSVATGLPEVDKGE